MFRVNFISLLSSGRDPIDYHETTMLSIRLCSTRQSHQKITFTFYSLNSDFHCVNRVAFISRNYAARYEEDVFSVQQMRFPFLLKALSHEKPFLKQIFSSMQIK